MYVLPQANLGDSRAVASVGGRAEALSSDHKPSNEAEQRRIVAAGGWVEFNRVNGEFDLHACHVCNNISKIFFVCFGD